MPNEQHPLHLAVAELQTMPAIDIKGKLYTQVSTRLAVFRKHFPDASISTALIHDDNQRVVIQATIVMNGITLATGYAEEHRGKGLINSTSALENAETSSIGRALACLSLSGNEYASANEVSNAIAQQAHNSKNTNQTLQSQNNSTPEQTNTQNTNEVQQLGAVGLALEYHGHEIIVTGSSYGQQALLKQFHYRFDPNRKCWWKQNNNQQVA